MRPDPHSLKATHPAPIDGSATRDRVLVILIAVLGIGWQVLCATLPTSIYYWLRASSPDILGPVAFNLSIYASSFLAWIGAFASCAFLLRRGGRPVWWAFAAVTCQHLVIAITIGSDLEASTSQQIALMLLAAPCLLWGSSIRKSERCTGSSTMSCARILIYALKSDGSLSPDEFDRCMALLPLLITVLLADVAYIAVGTSSSLFATVGMATIAVASSVVIIDFASRRNDRARLTGRAILSILFLIGLTVGAGWTLNAALGFNGISAANLVYALLGPGLLALLHVSGAAAKLR